MEYVLQWCESAFGHGNPLVRAAVLQDSTVRSHFCLRSSVTPVGTLSPQAPCGVLESQRVEWYGLFLPLPSSPLVRREGVRRATRPAALPRSGFGSEPLTRVPVATAARMCRFPRVLRIQKYSGSPSHYGEGSRPLAQRAPLPGRAR